MYLIRRVFKTKPGEARRVASLVQRQTQVYHDAGHHRQDFKVAFNGFTLPGEQDVVVLEWTASALQSPMREGNNLPPEALELGRQVRELIESQRIEFMELLSPDKALPL